MANTPKKVAVIGLDCAITGLIEKHIKDGHLPAFRKLFEAGVVAGNCLAPYPTITPPNWASIATGAWPGTHGVTDFHVHLPGTTPYNRNTVQAFGSDRIKAETLWDAADRAGKKCIVFNYPGGWPNKMQNGIVVGGSGLSIGENRDGVRGMAGRDSLCADTLITTGIFPASVRGKFQPATGWKDLPKKDSEPLELVAEMLFREAAMNPAPTTWFVLARQSGDNGYDRATLSPGRNFKDAFCTLAVGEWSQRIETTIKMEDGTEKEVFFRCKLLELSDDAEDLRLYISSIGTADGWSSPAEIARELKSAEGIVGHGGGITGYALDWYGMDTFVEINSFYTQFLADGVCTLLAKHDWDLLFMHAHSPDWTYHMIMTDMNADAKEEPERYQAAWDAHLKIYQAQDRMIAQIMQACDKDTLFILVSDHGAVADGPVFDPFRIFQAAGLVVMEEDPQSKGAVPTRATGMYKKWQTMKRRPDIHKSQVFPQRTCYVYINLKGRDPEGIVEPGDYERVQQQAIDALLTYVDPVTGQRPVSLALSKRDARILGLYGDGIGDVIYALYPWYAGQHGNILPAAEWGVGSLKPLLSFTGPGIRKGLRLERNCNLIDVVPTICYLMDLPVPSTVDGAILYQALKDPDFKSKEINKLRDGLARMETALQRGERQPWDKHECA